VRLPDSFSFRQKPTGAFKRILRVPVYLYRWQLGFLMGHRIVLLTHRGRKSGRRYQTPLEVVEHDMETHEYVVCSGTGPKADWYRNICAEPAAAIRVGNREWVPVQRLLHVEETAYRFKNYEAKHPKAARHLLDSMGKTYDGSDAGRLTMITSMPMVAFTDDTGPVRAQRH
jgi:deazaflavin-dependent oxidoreductase (nitroreductase family)